MVSRPSEYIHLQIVYALPAGEVQSQGQCGQTIINHTVAAGTSVKGAIEGSGILKKHPEIDFAVNRVGIFSTPVALEKATQEGDRIEIYRPLMVDPKERRRMRANIKKL